MWTAAIVIAIEFVQDSAKVPLVNLNQILQASRRIVPMGRLQNAFAWASRIGLFRTWTPESFEARPSVGEKMQITIVNYEAIGAARRGSFATAG